MLLAGSERILSTLKQDISPSVSIAFIILPLTNGGVSIAFSWFRKHFNTRTPKIIMLFQLLLAGSESVSPETDLVDDLEFQLLLAGSESMGRNRFKRDNIVVSIASSWFRKKHDKIFSERFELVSIASSWFRKQAIKDCLSKEGLVSIASSWFRK